MATLAKTKNPEEVPTIIGSVRLNKIVYAPGSEDELAKVITADQVTKLTEAGVLFGFGAPAPAEEEEGEEGSEEPTRRGRKAKDAE